MTDKRTPDIGEEFEWHGITLKTVECDANGCRHCYFNRYNNVEKSQGCIDHVCEGRRRKDETCVKFRKV